MIATPMFLLPLSPRTLEGFPYSSMADLNSSKTVEDLLSVLACKAMTCRESGESVLMGELNDTFRVTEAIHKTMDNNSPANQLVMPVAVPQVVWSL